MSGNGGWVARGGGGGLGIKSKKSPPQKTRTTPNGYQKVKVALGLPNNTALRIEISHV